MGEVVRQVLGGTGHDRVVIFSGRRCGDEPDSRSDGADRGRRQHRHRAVRAGRKSDSVATVAFVADDGELLLRRCRRTTRRRAARAADPRVQAAASATRSRSSSAISASPPEELYAPTVAGIVELVDRARGRSSPRGGLPDAPRSTWGGHRLETDPVRARAASDVGDVELITEPEAAARHYEATSSARARPDPRGLRPRRRHVRRRDPAQGRATATFGLVGEPRRHRRPRRRGLRRRRPAPRHRGIGPGCRIRSRSTIPPPAWLSSQLRRECVDAKEALSFDTEAIVPVLSASAHHRPPHAVRVRGDDRRLARPTIDVLDDALESAGLEADAARVDPPHRRLLAHPPHRAAPLRAVRPADRDRRRPEGGHRPRRGAHARSSGCTTGVSLRRSTAVALLNAAGGAAELALVEGDAHCGC